EPESSAQETTGGVATASGRAAAPEAGGTENVAAGDQSAEDRLRTRSTPVVRKIAEEHGIAIADVPGTGHAGRVTKQDILGYIESGAAEEPSASAPSPSAPPATPSPTPSAAGAPSDLWKAFYNEVQHPEFPVREADRVEPMDKIRRLTAEHMVVAKRVAPHVHSFIEVDFTTVDAVRKAMKPKWADQGVRVSYTAFVAWAVSRTLRDYPTVNGTVSGNNIIYRGNVNVGIAVDLDPGLIVPVIHDTDDLSLAGIGRRIVDLAERARDRKLQPSEIQGATFSITNPGVLGTMVGMPIIPKGTSAILGTGSIDKRVVVVEDPETGNDAMAIRKRCLFSLGYDHRLVDGADAARFLAQLKQLLENFPMDA
ncbi:MAG: dihydrolipoamide acetyltransferase family protein, partial [Gemmatimonadota bacterium]